MNFADVLWQVWLFYWFSAAFLGTLSAVFTAWGIREIYRAIRRAIARRRERQEQIELDESEYELVRKQK